MGYYPRSAWGARYGNGNAMAVPVSETYIHHTAGPAPRDEAAHMRELEAFHVNTRGWSGIAYSEVVFPSGNVYEGRGLGRTGAHTLDHNSISHAWCFVGNFENDQPTDGALRACAGRIRWAMGNGFVRPGSPIRGHRDVNQTACPGRNLYARLPEIRSFVASGAAPSPAPPPPPLEELDMGAVIQNQGATIAFEVVRDGPDKGALRHTWLAGGNPGAANIWPAGYCALDAEPRLVRTGPDSYAVAVQSADRIRELLAIYNGKSWQKAQPIPADAGAAVPTV